MRVQYYCICVVRSTACFCVVQTRFFVAGFFLFRVYAGLRSMVLTTPFVGVYEQGVAARHVCHADVFSVAEPFPRERGGESKSVFSLVRCCEALWACFSTVGQYSFF